MPLSLEVTAREEPGLSATLAGGKRLVFPPLNSGLVSQILAAGASTSEPRVAKSANSSDNAVILNWRVPTMANLDETTASLWQSMQRGEPAATALRKTLNLGDAYRVQLNLLARWQAAGKKLAGWKIGLSGASARKRMGLSDPKCVSRSARG
jgi:hypothetical protein